MQNSLFSNHLTIFASIKSNIQMRYFILFAFIIGTLSCKSDASVADTKTTANETVMPQNKPEAQKPMAQQKTETVKSNVEQSTVTSKKGSKNNMSRATTKQKPAKKKEVVKNNVQTKRGFTTNYNAEGIPDACDFMTVKTIGKYLDLDPESINISDGSSKNNLRARACFFKWDGAELPNAGVMLQIQKNPLPDDAPEYFTYFISNKKTEGEKDFTNNSKVFKYDDWDGYGDDGAYSTEAGKYLWRIGNEWAFMIAFNTTHPKKVQKRAAEALAKEIMSKMSFK